jgi:hypothetical protein
MSFSVEVTSRLSENYRRAASYLSGEGRAEASKAMGTEVQLAVVAHLRNLAGSKHDTANRLGASPTGFLARAADAAAGEGVVRSDDDGVTLAIRHPAVARAFRDITIVPKTAKALAIPIHAIAYNRRPAQIWESMNLFILGGKGQAVGRNVIAMKEPDGSILPLYILVRSVTQRQDRSLMPSDDEILDAAATGLKGYLRKVLTGGAR